MTPAVSFPSEGNAEGRRRAADLLRRYPELDDAEIEELIAFYRTAPAIDTALLGCDETLKANMALFEKTFRKRFSRLRDVRLTLAAYGLICVAMAIAIIHAMG